MNASKEGVSQYVWGLVYGVLALATNVYFVIPVYGNLSLHLGEIFVIFCLVTRGLPPALLASLLASLGLFITTGNPTFFLVSILEVLLLNVLLKKGIVLILADIIFWLFIGFPITFFIIVVIYNISVADFTLVVILKQGMNGLLIVSIVSLVRTFVPASWYSSAVKITTLKLSSRIFEVSLISIALPSLIVALILSDNSADHAEKQMTQLLQMRADNHVQAIDAYVDSHRDAIEALSVILVNEQLNAVQKQQILESWHRIYSGFVTMLIADSMGNIVHGSPEEAFKKLTSLPQDEKTVLDRSYFHVPKSTGQSYVSDIFRGRGVGEAPIIAVSASLLQEDEFIGIVEGSLDLPQFDGMDLGSERYNRYSIITDDNNNIVYASSELGLEVLERFDVKNVDITFTNYLPVLDLANNSFLYQTKKTNRGWTIYALAESSQLIGTYKQSFYKLTMALCIVALLALVFTRRFSKQVTNPLKGLVRDFAANQRIPLEISSVYTSKEIESVRQQLQKAQCLTWEYQRNLKDEVENKTAELMDMNEKLAQMSVEDDLTKISNRRGFEVSANELFKLACRNQTPLTFAILDIDHFKRVNDNWGHAIGDECIVMVANKLKQSFQRETDFFARYGGEEFVVLLTGGHTDKHCEMLEQLRKDIEKQRIVVDGRSIELTVSVGVYSLKENFDIDYHQLVSKADKLLYRSKNEGRNRITCGYQ